MAILQKCEECGREGGYAFNSEDTICARCASKISPKKAKNEEEEE
jgi:uncharacterized Zn ribbon protein